MSPLLRRGLLRYLSRHPWQLALAALGVALGVAVVLAVDLANASARKSFERSLEQVGGRATHRIRGGPAGVPEAVYARLRLEQGGQAIAPVVTGYARLSGRPGVLLQIVGVDPFAQASFRAPGATTATAGEVIRLLTEPDSALFPAALAASERLELQVGGRQATLRQAGRLAGAEGMLLTDIATAQALFDQPGRLSYIDLIAPDGPAGAALLAAIQRSLPPDLRLERTAERNEATARLSAAFSLNLTAMSLLAMVVGMFLIYNTMTFAVVQRRALLGMLRALGATRGELFQAVLSEALLLGLIGSLLGGALGVALGSALTQLVTRAIDDLYYTLTVRAYYIAPGSLLKAALLGVGATVLAAWLPAREAARAPARASLSRAHLESRRRALLPRLSLTGILLLALSGAGFALFDSLEAGFIALFTALLGCGLLVPAAVVLLTGLARRLTGERRLLARMASRDVARHLSRTGVAAAALMIALAATVGVGVTIDSFRGGVVIWIENLVNADIYIAPPSFEEGDYSIPLRPEVIAGLRAAAGVGGLSLYRHNRADIGARPAQLVALDPAPQAKAGYHLIAGQAEAAWRALEQNDAVIVSEPLAYRERLRPGMTLTLDTPQGPHAFPIAGVFLDYGSEHGRVLLHLTTYRRFWRDPDINSAAVYAAPGADVTALRGRLQEQLGPLQELIMRSSRDIQTFTLQVFDRTFAVTRVLRLLAIVVAFVGVLSALLALQLERAREFAVLRATGMTAGEIGWLVSLQTGLLGLIAGLLSLPVGVGLGAVLIFVIHRRSFGWTYPFQVDPGILLQAVGLAVVAALLAGVYPIWRTARTPPGEALRSE